MGLDPQHKSLRASICQNLGPCTFEVTIQIDVRPVPLHGDVGTILPHDAADGARRRGRARLEDHVIAHLLVDSDLCEDRQKLSVHVFLSCKWAFYSLDSGQMNAHVVGYYSYIQH